MDRIEILNDDETPDIIIEDGKTYKIVEGKKVLIHDIDRSGDRPVQKGEPDESDDVSGEA